MVETRIFTDRLILTPGPTEIPSRIRLAMARKATNPDLDPEFLDQYNKTRKKLAELVGAAKSDVYIWTGEAMLGLEAAIVNTVARGEKVLVVANGVFGEAFADLVKMRGGEPVVLDSSWRRSVDASEVERALATSGAEIVTLVHCDTPSALLNDLEAVARAVKERGALLVVDAVSSLGGVDIKVDDWGIDILIGGSQKVLNAPPGLTILTVSESAWEKINRVGYKGFYMSLKIWKDMLDTRAIFPYTFTPPLLYALNEALKMIFEEGVENVYRRHLKAREASWAALDALGLKPFPEAIDYSSPTVTAIELPDGVDEAKLRRVAWEKYGVMLAGSWGRLQGRVVRIGHMGVQASMNYLVLGYTALCAALNEQGYPANASKAVDSILSCYRS